MAARFAQQQQAPYGAQGQGFGYQEPQGQQQQFGQNAEQYGQDQQQYGEEQQGYGQDQYGQDEQHPDDALANGAPGAKPHEEEGAEHEEGAEEEHEEEIKGHELEPAASKAVGGRRQFPQDPHHAKLMSHFHEVAEHGLTDDHIHSMIHIGTYLMATLAKHTGMTAGHEPQAAGADPKAIKPATPTKKPAAPAGAAGANGAAKPPAKPAAPKK